MKSNNDKLKELIQEIVRKEVTKQVNKVMTPIVAGIIKEIRKPVKTTRIIESVAPVVEEMNDEDVYVAQGPAAPILQTKDPKLSAALAATAKNYKPLQKTYDDPGVTLNEEFEKIGSGEKVEYKNVESKIDFIKSMITENVQPASPSVTDNAAVPPELRKVFKKDFRSLMKKIDEQRSGLHPSVLRG